MKTSWVLGCLSLLSGACSSTSAPAPAPATASPAAVSVTPPPSASTEPAPVPTAKRCAEAKDVETCESACVAAEAGACLLLGGLYRQRDATDTEPGAEGAALHAFARACGQGDKAGCEQRDAGLQQLRDACKKTAKACLALGRVLEGLDEPHDQELDAAFERGCQAGDAQACQDRGHFHRDLEPRKIHQPLSEKSFDRGCALGSVTACCELVGLYQAADQEKKAAGAHARLEAANAKAEGRVACDHFNMARRPRVTVVAKADAASVQALGKERTALLEEVLSRNVASCFAKPPEPARLELLLVASSAAQLVRFSGGDAERCVERVVTQIHLPEAASLPAAFDLAFAAATPPH